MGTVPVAWEFSVSEDLQKSLKLEGAAKPMLIASKYEVVSELGQGGFGTVVKARHVGLNKFVAIKILHNTLVIDALARTRFEQEANTGASLSHPNLVPVFDYGFTEENQAYLVMEYVEGVTLDDYLAEHKLKVDELLELLAQVAKAIRYLHENKIIHRDLKASNILIQEIGGERYAKIVDLGIAKVFSPDGAQANINLTTTGTVFGSPAYMCPEQCQGHHVDERSDIYSFGCVMYQCISGRQPFGGDNPLQVILKHLHDVPAALEYKTQREFDFNQLIMRCIEKDREKRYQSMKQLIESLQKIQSVSESDNANVKPSSRSRTYAVDTAPPSAPSNAVAIAGVVIVVALIAFSLVPLYYILSSQLSKIPPPALPVSSAAQDTEAAKPLVPAAATSPPVERSVTPVPTSVAPPVMSPGAEADRLAAERTKNEELARKVAADREAIEKVAAAQLDREKRDAAQRAMYQQQANELAKASNERFDLVQRALKNSSRSMNSGNDQLREYNRRVEAQDNWR